jgi:hypothetical protein
MRLPFRLDHAEPSKMRAIEYSRTGDPDVLSLVDRPVPEPVVALDRLSA